MFSFLFEGGIIFMEVPKTIGILGQTQDKINRQFYKMLMDAEAGDAAAIKKLVDAVGDETTANTILYRIKTVETTIGNNTSGLVKDVADIKTAIGDESTADSILGRIKALEDAS